MSDWSLFIEPNYEHCYELLVGPHEIWIRRIPRGLTQLDRAMIHTPMMDLAHERRVVIAQDQLDLSDYESNHCERIQQALSLLENNILMYRRRIKVLDLADIDTNCAGGQFNDAGKEWPQKVTLAVEKTRPNSIPISLIIDVAENEPLLAGDDESEDPALRRLLASLKTRSDASTESRNMKRHRVRKDSDAIAAQAKRTKKYD